ncbi:MAG: glycosyltransferase family 2 protein [Hyphomonadaceae bacterium]|nr:glycosyltransferase family 2 protein [Hyphomonadaceae bacterium]
MSSTSAAPPRNVGVIIPCLEEEDAIGACVAAVLATGVGEVIVVDGQSRDLTAERAAAAGATVVIEPMRGYGRAMLSGLAALSPTSTIVLFIDGDGSDRPELIPAVLAPIEHGHADFVLGSRLRGEREPGSLAMSQLMAGQLAGLLIRLLYGVRFTDMSPFRAIRRDVLDRLGMTETSFGWNLEMQMRVAAAGLRVVEVPVGQRRRAGGTSKVAGNWRSAGRAAWVLVRSFCRLAWRLRRDGRPAPRPLRSR